MADAPWSSGHVIDGKYRLTLKLGEGGMGAVWRADHLTLNAPVAVKLLDPSIAATEDGAARFIREAQAAAALRSAHVVQTFDYGVSEGVPFIVMELLVGDSLGDRLASGVPLSPSAVASLLKQLGRAIGKAHQQGIVHRDLKPDNIFLVETDGDDFTAKVLDFGIAKATSILGISTGSKTRTGALLGTPYYMSPEQAQGIKEVDFRTDLWALAVITFECLTGKRPFESEALGDLLLKICASPMPVPSELAPVPVGFDEWFAKAANREREDRFSSAMEMAKAFEGLVDPSKLSGNDSYTSLLPSSRAAPSFRAKPAGDSLEGTLVASGSPRPSGRNVVWITTGATLAGLAVILGVFATGGDHQTARAAASAAPAQSPVPLPPPRVEPAAPVAVEFAAPTTASAAASAATIPRAGPARHAVTKAVAPKASAPPAAAPALPAPKAQDPFDPLQMRR